MISESKIHLRLEINSNCYLQILTPEDVSSEYIRWLNDYEISKYTEQRFETHNHETVAKFVAQKYQSSSDFLFGIYLRKSPNIHLPSNRRLASNTDQRMELVFFEVG